MSSKPATQPSTTTQVAEPWAGQQPYLQELFGRASGLLGSGGPQFFPGSMIAPQSAATGQAQTMAQNLAGSLQPAVNKSLETSLWNMGGGRDVANHPYLKSAIQAAQQPVVERFYGLGGPAAGIRGHFTAGNSGGSGTREGIAQGVAEKGLNQQLVNMSAGMTMDAYNRAQEDSIRSLALMPQTMQGAAFPASLMEGVGASQDMYAQSLIDADMTRWNYNQNLPWMNLSNFQNFIGGQNYGSSGTTTSDIPIPKANPWMGAAGGAATGYALGGMIGGTAKGASYGPWGALIGAGLGYLASR